MALSTGAGRVSTVHTLARIAGGKAPDPARSAITAHKIHYRCCNLSGCAGALARYFRSLSAADRLRQEMARWELTGGPETVLLIRKARSLHRRAWSE